MVSCFSVAFFGFWKDGAETGLTGFMGLVLAGSGTGGGTTATKGVWGFGFTFKGLGAFRTRLSGLAFKIEKTFGLPVRL